MFDYVSAREIQLLRKLRVSGSEVHVTSDQRIRLELHGLITDGSNGIRLTAKGLRVAEARYDDERRIKFEPLIVRLAG
jgi:Mn-dependent DtxR family transcriptional regulator